MLSRKVYCRAKNPTECVYHGTPPLGDSLTPEQVSVLEQEFRGFTPTEIVGSLLDNTPHPAVVRHLNLLRNNIVSVTKEELLLNADIQNNVKLRTLKDGTTVANVFRSGTPAAPTERGVEAVSYLKADEYTPEGRQGRTTGIFAAPTISGVSRWLRANTDIYSNIENPEPHQITINADTTYVYNIKLWEKFSNSYYGGELNPTQEEAIKQYWETGLTYREYLQKVQEDPLEYDPTEWELLIPAEGVLKSQRISFDRVIAFTPKDYVKEELADAKKRFTKKR